MGVLTILDLARFFVFY